MAGRTLRKSGWIGALLRPGNLRASSLPRSLAAVALVLAAVPAPRAAAADLISIKGVSLGADEYVAGFDFAIDGLDVLAVCHILDDWTVTVRNGHPPDSHISGAAGHGASGLAATRLDRLTHLFLVGPKRDSVGGTGHAPPIVGVLTLGLYGDGGHFRRLALGPANIGWERATTCR
jgi:hypothetical protein